MLEWVKMQLMDAMEFKLLRSGVRGQGRIAPKQEYLKGVYSSLNKKIQLETYGDGVGWGV